MVDPIPNSLNSITWTRWQTVRRITNEILGVEGLRLQAYTSNHQIIDKRNGIGMNFLLKLSNLIFHSSLGLSLTSFEQPSSELLTHDPALITFCYHIICKSLQFLFFLCWPYNPKSDKHLISPYMIPSELHI